MKMDVDEEGTKTNDDSVDIRSAEIPTGDNTAESYEQNLNTSQHNNYERNGKIRSISYIIYIQYDINILRYEWNIIKIRHTFQIRNRKCQRKRVDCSSANGYQQGKVCCWKWGWRFAW